MFGLELYNPAPCAWLHPVAAGAMFRRIAKVPKSPWNLGTASDYTMKILHP